MKTIVITLTVSLGVLFAGCSKNDDNNPKFSSKFIYQTSWEGKLLIPHTNDIRSYVGISFATENRGSHRTTDYADGYATENTAFTYSVENKLITINRDLSSQGNALLNGDWLVVSVEKDKLILRCETPGFILELNRVMGGNVSD